MSDHSSQFDQFNTTIDEKKNSQAPPDSGFEKQQRPPLPQQQLTSTPPSLSFDHQLHPSSLDRLTSRQSSKDTSSLQDLNQFHRHNHQEQLSEHRPSSLISSIAGGGSGGSAMSTITQDSINEDIEASSNNDTSSKNSKLAPSSTTSNRKKRIRISKACNFCRKKKIKCDGAKPCLNCQQSNNNDCDYSSDSEKKIKALKLSSGTAGSTISAGSSSSISKASPRMEQKSFNNIDTRLLNIESVLMDLVGKLRSNKSNSVASTTTHITTNRSFNDINEEGEELDEEDTNEDSAANPIAITNFFGSHAIVDIFTKKSLDFILSSNNKNLKAENQIIHTITRIFGFYQSAFLDSISQPIKIGLKTRADLLTNIFKNADIPIEILSRFDDIFMLNYICDKQYVKNLYGRVFENKDEESTKKDQKKPSVTWSELMIMTTSVALCISTIIDERNVPKLRKNNGPNKNSKILNSITDQELIEYDTKLFFSMIFYYARLCMFGEGIRTVQALISFVIYIESVVSTVKTNFMPIAVAIRYSLELGLHRNETYEGLSWDEQHLRKTLWWFCENYDGDYSFRHGKPLILRLDELSSYSESDVITRAIIRSNADLIKSLLNKELVSKKKDHLLINNINETKAIYRRISYVMYFLGKNRMKSYELLYSAKTYKEKLSVLINNLSVLNEDMKWISELIEEPLIVRFYNDPKFIFKPKNRVIEIVYNLESGFENIALLNFSYFLHLMTINRIALQNIKNIEENKSLIVKCEHFKLISIDCARTIIQIVKEFNLKLIFFSNYSYFLFYPFAAFMHLGGLILNDVNNESFANDITALIELSLNFLSYKHWQHNKSTRVKRNCVRQTVYDFITRVILKMILKELHSEEEAKYYSNYKQLKKHLDLFSSFPEFYTTKDQLGVDVQSTTGVFKKWFRPYESLYNSKHAVMERQIDSILKNAISPSLSTQVRSQEYEDYLNQENHYHLQQQQQNFSSEFGVTPLTSESSSNSAPPQLHTFKSNSQLPPQQPPPSNQHYQQPSSNVTPQLPNQKLPPSAMSDTSSNHRQQQMQQDFSSFNDVVLCHPSNRNFEELIDEYNTNLRNIFSDQEDQG